MNFKNIAKFKIENVCSKEEEIPYVPSNKILTDTVTNKLMCFLTCVFGYVLIFAVIFICALLFSVIIYFGIKYDNVLSIIKHLSLFPGIIAVTFIYLIIKSGYKRNNDFMGYEINIKNYKNLFEEINSICKEFKVNKIKKIIITDYLDSRLIYFKKSFFTSNIVVDIQLFQLLELEEIKILLAREIINSKNGSKFFDYTNYMFNNLVDELNYKKTTFVIKMLTKQISWYNNLLNKNIYLYNHRKYFYIDKELCKFYDKSIVSELIIKYEIIMNFYQEIFNTKLEELATYEKEVPNEIYEITRLEFCRNMRSDKYTKKIVELFTKKNQYFINRPSLKERIDNLNCKLEYNINFDNRYNIQEIRNEVENIVNNMSNRWKDYNKEYFELIKSENEENIKRLYFLELNNDLSISEKIEKAELIYYIRGSECAIKEYNNILKLHENNVEALINLANIYLNENKIQGINLLVSVINNDITYAIPYIEVIKNYYIENSLDLELIKIKEWTNEKLKLHNDHYIENTEISCKEEYMKHDLPFEIMDCLLKQLKLYNEVERIYVAKKIVKYSKNDIYVCGIRFKSFTSETKQEEAIEKIFKENENIQILFFSLNDFLRAYNIFKNIDEEGIAIKSIRK